MRKWIFSLSLVCLAVLVLPSLAEARCGRGHRGGRMGLFHHHRGQGMVSMGGCASCR